MGLKTDVDPHSTKPAARVPSRWYHWRRLRIAAVSLVALGTFGVWFAGRSHPPSSSSAALAIPVEAAKYLQDVEHLGGFVLGDVAFPQLSQALREGNSRKLASYFSPEFKGLLWHPSGGQSVELRFAQLRTWKEDRDPRVSCNRDEFVADLIAYRDEFKELKAAKFKVMQMGPVARGELTGPWAGTFKLRLAGRTAEHGLAERVIKFRCQLSELSDQTPQHGGWMLACEAYLGKLARSEDFLMEDMSADTGIDTQVLQDNWQSSPSERRPMLTGGVYLADYDQDGRMDVLLTDLNGVFLYKGRGNGEFVDVTDEVGLPRSLDNQIGAVFADLDGDGFEDLLIGPHLFRNREGRRFERLVAGKETNLSLRRDATKFAVADYDRDGRLDLLVVGLRTGKRTSAPYIGKSDASFNQLWRNLGDWKFEEVARHSGAIGNGIESFAAAWFDANADDWPDLMVANEFGPNDYLVNQGDGSFRPGVLPEGYGGFSMGITVSDIDNDGYPDPYVASMYSKAGQRIVANVNPDLYSSEVYSQIQDFVTGSELYHNSGDGTFQRAGQAAGVAQIGWAYGAGYVDLDSDGFPDVYAPCGFQTVSAAKPDG